jgi:hypothetical protein
MLGSVPSILTVMGHLLLPIDQGGGKPSGRYSLAAVCSLGGAESGRRAQALITISRINKTSQSARQHRYKIGAALA